MKNNFDIIIIGSGVIGAATAYELSKLNYKTINIDSNGEAGHGSTSGSCAIIRVHYSTIEGTALAWESYHYWKNWKDYLEVTDERGLAKFHETGCLVLQTKTNNFLKKHIEICKELNIPFRIWDKNQIVENLPNYSLNSFAPAKRPEDPNFGIPNKDHINSGVFFPTAGYVNDPALSAHNLQRASENYGATYKFNSKVIEILRTPSKIRGVKLDDKSEIFAPVVINVAGPASSVINKMANVQNDMKISTNALKQEVIHLPLPENYSGKGRKFVISDSDISLYCRPEQDNYLLVGSEDPPCDPSIWIENPYDERWKIPSEQSRIQAMRMAQRLTNLGIPNQPKSIVDLYDVTDDWIPIYDKSSLPGFFMACGTSGNQYKNAPVAGKIMANLVDGFFNNINHDLNPITLNLSKINFKLNLSCFSRNREINDQSSFSVLG